jgi:hypothetical protein
MYDVIDVTEGREAMPVILKRTPEAEEAYKQLRSSGFEYHSKALLPLDDLISRDSGCPCTGLCAATCSCARFGCFYIDGLLDLARLSHDSVLLECSEVCSCAAACPNRLVQRGLQRVLTLEWNNSKGFSLNAGEAIPTGAYVCSYQGEIISTTEARRRWTSQATENKSNYILVLKEHGANGVLKTSIDPSLKGNMGRFISQFSLRINSSAEALTRSFLRTEPGHLHRSPTGPFPA